MTMFHPTSGAPVRLYGDWWWLWPLLLGPVWFSYRGLHGHALGLLIGTVPTLGVMWVAYAFLARSIIRESYVREGWLEAQPYVTTGAPRQPPAVPLARGQR